MSTNLDSLIERLNQTPDNTTLRLAVMRRAMGADMGSRALELAFDLDPEAVKGSDDRALVAEVYELAGLDDDRDIWLSPVSNTETDLSEIAPAEPAPEAFEEDEETASQNDVDEVEPFPKKHAPLRVVGGADANPIAEDPVDQPLTFADVGGLDVVKKEVQRRIIAPFSQAGLLSKFRKKAGGGVLLYGPPGCGKTLIARAMAGEAGFDFLHVSISDILDSMVGESERRLSAIFDKARSGGPTVLFFDEIDALGSKRTSTSAVHHSQLVSHFLAEMDGAGNRNDGVLMLAATNIPWSMDSAFLRPGRFDRLFFIPPPDRTAREAILKLELAERPAAPNLRIDKVAANSSGLSGADLAQIIERAADFAIDATLDAGKEVPIDNKMLSEAAGLVKSSVTDWLTTARNHATYANETGRYDDVLSVLKKHGRA